MNSKTYLPKDKIQRNWHIIDASGKVLGRLSTEVADKLRGKRKSIFTPHIDCGDFVIVTNASKIVLTGKKLEQKTAFRHSHQPGGATFTSYSKIMAETPEKAVQKAVKGMLPKNKLASRQITRLKVYRDSNHPHSAQFGSAKKQTEK
ncbi:50S ribosomal protein L13 [Elusimicrobiota bacterium]